VDLAADALLAMIGGRGDPRRDGEPVRSDRIARPVHLQHALLGLFISNTATAVLMEPVALAIAQDLHGSPYPFAMIVALAGRRRS